MLILQINRVLDGVSGHINEKSSVGSSSIVAAAV